MDTGTHRWRAWLPSFDRFTNDRIPGLPARTGHMIVTRDDGNVYVIGGAGEKLAFHADIWQITFGMSLL